MGRLPLSLRIRAAAHFHLRMSCVLVLPLSWIR